MSDAAILAVIGAVPPTILAFGTLVVSVRNARKADVIIEKAAEIHTLANSNLSKVTSSLDIANAKIEGLLREVKILTDAKGVADRLAVAVVAVPLSAVVSSPDTTVPVPEVIPKDKP